MCKSSFGVANVLQRRAIVNGYNIGGKERPMLIISDTELHNPFRYACSILMVGLTHSRKTDMDIPIQLLGHERIYHGLTLTIQFQFL